MRPEFEPSSRPFSLLAYARLVRLPNVFTAVADVLMGYLFTHESLDRWPELALLIGSSALLYMAGMVLNDLFDQYIDAAERPGRPIPSGQVSESAAARLGWGMLVGGVLLGTGAAGLTHNPRPAIIAVLLAGAVVLYDRVLKRLPIGPLGMGLCRLLNVLLGMSLSETVWLPIHWHVAAGIGVYIVGVTWLARTEAVESSRPQLAGAVIVMLAGIGLLATIDRSISGREWPAVTPPDNWQMFWLVIGLLIGWRALRAVADPYPTTVQAAVKNCILGLIVLDAAVCRAVHDPTWCFVILALLAPTILLGLWIEST